jgi:hypothetical protein
VKPSSRPHRTPSKLSDSVLHQLNMYALTASAAAVGMLALAQPAEAKVVYTAAHHVILRGSHFALDLNHDGIADFYLNHRSGCSSEGFCSAALYAMGGASGGNYVEGIRKIFNFKYALKPQQRIGSTKPFMGFAMYYRFRAQGTSGACSGSWADVKNRYLGLRFIIKGETHFGWARLNVACNLGSKKIGLLTGYAYETVPNKPIIAGKTMGPDVITVQSASLGQLARGGSATSGLARESKIPSRPTQAPP